MFGTKAGLFVDVFLLVQLLVLPALLVAVAAVRRGKVARHARIMQVAFYAFLLSVIAFEVEVRLGPTPPVPLWILGIHLSFALPALGLWALQLVRGKQAFLDPAAHRRRGRILLALLSATVATGFWLYAATY
ncbi:MAG: DUF420 domain-containing protein [Planctomycetes bacterium]|nr:DUF420 domain-containing protein [Planctomycetota bacterium]